MANAAAIKRLRDSGQRRKGTSVLVYGPPKVGKSGLVAQLAKHFTLHWFDIENGADVLFNEKVVDPALLENINLYQIPDYKGNPLGIEYTMKAFKGERLNLCDVHSVHECSKCKVHNRQHPDDPVGFNLIKLHELDPNKDVVVVDSLTQCTRSAAALITDKQLNGEDSKFEYDHWRLQNVYLDILMDMAQAGMFNVVCITHEDGIQQVDGTEKIMPSASTRNYGRSVAKNFNTVVRCFMNGTVHGCASATSQQPKAITGSRDEVDVAKDGLAAVFNPALRSKPSEDTSKVVSKRKPRPMPTARK